MLKWYDAPEFMTIEGWDEWRETTKKQYPIQYFLREDLTAWFRHNVSMRLENWKWAVLQRVHPKHQYHIIRTGLKPNYYDPATRILHGTFSLIEEYVEIRGLRGSGIKGTRWTQEDVNDENNGGEYLIQQIDAEAAAIALADWWIARRDRPDPWENVPEHDDKPFMWVIMKKYKDTPELEEWRKASNAAEEQEQKWAEEDQQKLREVADLLPSLWYP